MPGNKKPRKRKKPQPVQHHGILVTVKQENTGRSLEVGVLGNVKLTEAPTLLRLAAKSAEQQLGLE